MRARNRSYSFLSETLLICAMVLALGVALIDDSAARKNRGYVVAAGCAVAGGIAYVLSVTARKKP
jgi:hypothetical protein